MVRAVGLRVGVVLVRPEADGPHRVVAVGRREVGAAGAAVADAVAAGREQVHLHPVQEDGVVVGERERSRLGGALGTARHEVRFLDRGGRRGKGARAVEVVVRDRIGLHGAGRPVDLDLGGEGAALLDVLDAGRVSPGVVGAGGRARGEHGVGDVGRRRLRLGVGVGVAGGEGERAEAQRGPGQGAAYPGLERGHGETGGGRSGPHVDVMFSSMRQGSNPLIWIFFLLYML